MSGIRSVLFNEQVISVELPNTVVLAGRRHGAGGEGRDRPGADEARDARDRARDPGPVLSRERRARAGRHARGALRRPGEVTTSSRPRGGRRARGSRRCAAAGRATSSSRRSRRGRGDRRRRARPSRLGRNVLMRSPSIAPSMTTCATWMPCGPNSRDADCASARSAALPGRSRRTWPSAQRPDAPVKSMHAALARQHHVERRLGEEEARRARSRATCSRGTRRPCRGRAAASCRRR